NPAFVAHLGYTEQEALTRPYLEFVHPDDRARTNAKADEIVEGETTVSFENRYVCKDGSYRWIEWTAAPVAEERLTYAVGRDVTERRRAEADLREAEERNRALAEEQAALRRVATLVARGVPRSELFAAVAQEVGQLFSLAHVAMSRYESDGTITVVATSAPVGDRFAVGGRWGLGGKNVTQRVAQTGRTARLDDSADR